MPVYCIAFALSMIMAAVFCHGSLANKKSALVWLPVMPILLVSVFRYGIGTDYLGVYDFGYESVVLGRVWNYSRFEPGYIAINFLVYFLHGTSFWVFAIMAVIFHYFMYRFILDWSENVPLSLLVLFVSQQWLFSLSAIRQAAAIALVVFSIKYVCQKKPLKYLFFISLAASLHFMALVFVPLYWLFRRRYSQCAVLFCSLFVLAISYLSPSFFQSVAGLFNRQDYFDSAYYKGRLYYVEFAFAFLFTVVLMLMQSKNSDFDKKYEVLINVAIFGLFAASASALIPNAERFDMFFTATYIVLIPAVAKSCKTQLSMFALTVLLVSSLGARLVYDTYFNGDGNGIAEYHCIFFDENGRI